MSNLLSRRWSMPRRSFLRGVGVALALPLLDAMAPLAAADPVSYTHLGGMDRSAGGPRSWCRRIEGRGADEGADRRIGGRGLAVFQVAGEPAQEAIGPADGQVIPCLLYTSRCV